MELIVDCASAIMESQRASLFIYDHETEELFTQIQKAQNQIIRIPYNQGIVGSVFCTKQIVNLINAQNDSRFKKEIDMIDQDQVDTILCAPILDLTNRQILGVLQCTNKRNGYFTQDDEEFLKITCKLAAIILKNSEQYDKSIALHNNLRTMLSLGLSLQNSFSEESLVKEATA